ncbi:MAG: cell division protein FtsX [Bacteroidetes bacterium 4572_114]|nr:MAG: cell division protein FtsX [Bacteroidetes bacterium 4572_114]
MRQREEKYYRRKVNTSYITSVISISLVLFTLGVLGFFVINAKSISRYIRENIGFEIIMEQNTREADILHLQKMLDTKPYVKSTEYITKEEAARRLSDALGEDFTGFFSDEDNPLLPSIDVRFNAEWANNDSLAKIQTFVLSNKGVKDVYYQKSLIHIINRNLRRISFILLGLSLLLLIIAVALINNTIRLAIYSRRFIIRSMQLVGATRTFIQKPFIIKGIVQGITSAVIALILLTAIIAGLWNNLPELKPLSSPEMLLFLYLFVLVTGMFVSGILTYFAVRKYLNLKPDRLYG